MGEELAAAQAVARAERTFEQIVPANEPEWARFIDAAYVFGEAALCFRDMSEPEQVSRFATESAQEAARQQRARRGALSNAALAAAMLSAGDVEGAAQASNRVVDLTATVDSTRCMQVVRDLSERLRPYSGLHEVAVFQEHAHGQLGDWDYHTDAAGCYD